MALELRMPALSPTMEKGTLAKWLVREGDDVKAGDVIAEIETDKATMEYEAVGEGRVAQLVVAEGTDDVVVGTVIALLAVGDPPARQDPPAMMAANAPSDVVVRNDATPALPSAVPHSHVASPLVRRLAAAKGIDLSGIAGSGAGGAIVRSDLGLSPAAAGVAPAVVAPGNTERDAPPVAVTDQAPPVGIPVETIKLGAMRKTIARRLSESKRTIPHFYLTARCNLDALLNLRGDLNEGLASRGVKLSVNDMLIKAMALAMVDVPAINVRFGGDVLHRFDRADISMAVAIDGGLVTPVIGDVGAKSLSAIAQQSRALAERARDGRLMPEDYQGGTATISNLGMFGIDEILPVINPPQALILGIASGVERPWKVNGVLALATIIAATGSFDHRAIDGATAAQFMSAFRERIEGPFALLG